MPKNTYICPKCGYTLEYHAAPLCPTCWENVVKLGIDQGRPVSRHVRMTWVPTGAPAIAFKGAGWTAKGPGRRV